MKWVTCPILFLLCPRRNEFLCKLLIINDDTWAQVVFLPIFTQTFFLSTFRYVLGDTLCLIWKHVNQMGENFWVFPYFVPDCNLNSLETFFRKSSSLYLKLETRFTLGTTVKGFTLKKNREKKFRGNESRHLIHLSFFNSYLPNGL